MLAALLVAAAVCPSQKLAHPRFPAGETLTFRLDAMGADVGEFDLRVEPPPPEDRAAAALLIKSHAKTSAFVSTNIGRFEAFASTLLRADLSPLRYREDAEEGADHKAWELRFPPPAGATQVPATKNGNPDPFTIDAGSDARDILSALFFFRAQPLREGQPICLEVIAGRRVWKVEGAVAARETIDTPMGPMASARIDANATRVDDPRVVRTAHVWVSDDEKRLPLVAVGEMKGKVMRAQLVEASSASRKREKPKVDAHAGAAIGR